MKTTLTALALAAITASTAMAQEPAADPCMTMGDLAQTIMERRQEGVPMSTLMELTGHLELARLLVIEAYNRPRMYTDGNQTREVQDFRNVMEAACYQMQ